jgi:hypothetical protein
VARQRKRLSPLEGDALIHKEVSGVKVVSSPTYEVDQALHAQLAQKYSSFMPEFVEFTVGPSKIRVDKRIIEGLIRKPGQEAGFNLSILWSRLLKICGRLRITGWFANIAVVLDEAVGEPLHMTFEDESDGPPWGYVFFPPSQLNAPLAHFAFVLLHELCHCLLDIPEPKSPKEIYDYEFFVDVLSMAAFRGVFPPNTGEYEKTIQSLSCVAAEELRERLGPDVQREILRDPQAYLCNMVEILRDDTEGQGLAMSAEKAV